MHIIIKKPFWSLPFVSHGTTFGKKPYWNLWFLITYSTIFTANLISSLVLGTKIFYSRTNWQNCFGSVDGTVLQIFRPKINQNIVYNGHKRAHRNRNINEVIRTVLNFFFFTIRFHKYKKAQKSIKKHLSGKKQLFNNKTS